MNRLRHLMSLCIFISLMACEQNEDWVVNEPMQSFEENPEYAPLNTIPDWVSEKVTPKEYELWRTMSSRYEINYSFLKKDISENALYLQTLVLLRDIKRLHALFPLILVNLVHIMIPIINPVLRTQIKPVRRPDTSNAESEKLRMVRNALMIQTTIMVRVIVPLAKAINILSPKHLLKVGSQTEHLVNRAHLLNIKEKQPLAAQIFISGHLHAKAETKPFIPNVNRILIVQQEGITPQNKLINYARRFPMRGYPALNVDNHLAKKEVFWTQKKRGSTVWKKHITDKPVTLADFTLKTIAWNIHGLIPILRIRMEKKLLTSVFLLTLTLVGDVRKGICQ